MPFDCSGNTDRSPSKNLSKLFKVVLQPPLAGYNRGRGLGTRVAVPLTGKPFNSAVRSGETKWVRAPQSPILFLGFSSETI